MKQNDLGWQVFVGHYLGFNLQDSLRLVHLDSLTLDVGESAG